MKPGYYILNKKGHPIQIDSIHDWGNFMGNPDKKTVVRDEIKGTIISTVFLGLDHNYSNIGKPILFETMVFGNKKYEDFQQRYCTRKEALEGHHNILNELFTKEEIELYRLKK